MAAPSCAAAGSGAGGVTYPADPPDGLTSFTDAGVTFTIQRAAGGTLRWTSTAPIATVLVRGDGVVQPWPADGATSGAGLQAPTDGTVIAPIDDVTFCFPDAPAPPPEVPKPLRLGLVARGTFTRVPPRIDVGGVVTIKNPNPTSVPMDGLDVVPSTQGSCASAVPLQVPSGDTPVAFSCDIDIDDAARQGEVRLTVRSRSAAPATATVTWTEARTR